MLPSRGRCTPTKGYTAPPTSSWPRRRMESLLRWRTGVGVPNSCPNRRYIRPNIVKRLSRASSSAGSRIVTRSLIRSGPASGASRSRSSEEGTAISLGATPICMISVARWFWYSARHVSGAATWVAAPYRSVCRRTCRPSGRRAAHLAVPGRLACWGSSRFPSINTYAKKGDEVKGLWE